MYLNLEERGCNINFPFVLFCFYYLQPEDDDMDPLDAFMADVSKEVHTV